jgi:hypothetical protein
MSIVSVLLLFSGKVHNKTRIVEQFSSPILEMIKNDSPFFQVLGTYQILLHSLIINILYHCLDNNSASVRTSAKYKWQKINSKMFSFDHLRSVTNIIIYDINYEVHVFIM